MSNPPPPVLPYRDRPPPRPGPSTRLVLERVADGLALLFAFLASCAVVPPRTTWEYTFDGVVTGTVVGGFVACAFVRVLVRRRPLRRCPETAIDLLGLWAVLLLVGRQAFYNYTDPGYPRPRWRPDAFDAARTAGAVLLAYLIVRVLVTLGRRLVTRSGKPDSA